MRYAESKLLIFLINKILKVQILYFLDYIALNIIIKLFTFK